VHHSGCLSELSPQHSPHRYVVLAVTRCLGRFPMSASSSSMLLVRFSLLHESPQIKACPESCCQAYCALDVQNWEGRPNADTTCPRAHEETHCLIKPELFLLENVGIALHRGDPYYIRSDYGNMYDSGWNEDSALHVRASCVDCMHHLL
jgi:hypothetical protein